MTKRIILPGVDEDATNTLNHLLARLDEKQPRNVLRSSYYDGRRALRQISQIVPPQYNNLGIVLGWCAKAVDLMARRCNLDGFSWPGGDLDSIGARQLWDANWLGVEIDQAIVSSLEHGIAYVVTTKGQPGEPTSLIQFRDATQAIGDWNERTRTLDNLLVITGYAADGEISGLVLYLPNLTIEAVRDGGWQVTQQDHPWGVPAEPLVYNSRLRRRTGSSRITRPAMSIQDQAVRELIRLEGHMDVFSYPEMWMLGAEPSVFKNPDGSTKAPWQVMLGRIKGLPDDDEAEQPRADVKQFPAASPEPHLAALNAFSKLFARETNLPDTSVAITQVANPTSAESYDAAQWDLIAEAEGATTGWTVGLRRAYLRGLAMQNGLTEIPAEWLTVQARWRNPRFLSRAAEADAGLKQLQAVPWLADTEVGLELLGLSDAQRERALAERQRARSQQMLTQLTASTPDASETKAKADALGVLIRSGVDPQAAARQVGLDGVEFTGAMPVSLRLPESDATQLEQR